VRYKKAKFVRNDFILSVIIFYLFCGDIFSQNLYFNYKIKTNATETYTEVNLINKSGSKNA